MSLELRTVKHDFGKPQSLHIKIFKSPTTLLRHLQDHCWKENEPWDRHLRRTLLSQSRKKWEKERVIEQGFYDHLVEALNENLSSSSKAPLYIWALQERNQVRTKSLFALGHKGLIMVISDNVLRTAYFPRVQSNISGSKSNYNLFDKAWLDIKRKLARKEYYDSKGEVRVITVETYPFSPENWDSCPNPYKPPQKRRKLRDKSIEESICEWYSVKEE